jgi:hypothetical protein
MRRLMSKYKFLGVHTLHFQLTDKDGNTDGKLYEYTGDHSSFADGIGLDELEEVDPYTSLMEQGEKDK